MGFWKRLFGRQGEVQEEVPDEIVEHHLCIDEAKYRVRIKKGGQEIFGWDFFQAALKTQDFSFGRFYLVNEKIPNTHFAPSLEQAIQWFRGKGAPKDGYLTICWGSAVTAQCHICRISRKLPLKISKVECLVVYTDLPEYMEIQGWRVIEVDNEVLGKGMPTKIVDIYKTHPIIQWYFQKDKFLCQNCAQRLIDVGKGHEIGDCAIFPLE